MYTTGAAAAIAAEERLVSRVARATARPIGFCRVWPPAVDASGTKVQLPHFDSPQYAPILIGHSFNFHVALSGFRRLYAPALVLFNLEFWEEHPHYFSLCELSTSSWR